MHMINPKNEQTSMQFDIKSINEIRFNQIIK